LINLAIAEVVGIPLVDLSRQLNPHPRLMLTDRALANIRADILQDKFAADVFAQLHRDATRLLVIPVLEHRLEGKRLLAVAREGLRRIATLAIVFKVGGDVRFLARAQLEMQALAAFPDFNPSHFLDTAGIATALALGYDWLYDDLDRQTRLRVRQAIIDKALRPSLTAESSWWVGGNTNWTIVCHAGIALGALAVADEDLDIATKVIQRAVNDLRRSIAVQYPVDEAFPEGPGYWAYATTFTAMLIDCLRSSLNHDFRLEQQGGFSRTHDYFMHVIAPSGKTFNYGDAAPDHSGFEPVMYWFARARHAPQIRATMDLLANQHEQIVMPNRFKFAILLWRPLSQPSLSTRLPLDWSGGGSKPVSVHRSAWDEPQATFVGVCGGAASVPHAHLDAGGFVFETGGIRWIIELGYQDYLSLEQKNVNLWDHSQDSQRWEVFRIGAFGHSTLSIDHRRPCVKGSASLTQGNVGGPNPFTLVDLTPIYADRAISAQRGIAMPGRQMLIVNDHLVLRDKQSTIQSRFVTNASATPLSKNTCLLEQNGQKLLLKCVRPVEANIAVIDVQSPRRDFDAENRNTRIVQITIPSGKHVVDLVVELRLNNTPRPQSADYFVSSSSDKWLSSH
jgi:hypothetical protein